MDKTLKISKIIAHLLHSSDELYIYFDGPPTFPWTAEKRKPFLKMEIEAGHGVEYSEKVFGISPDIIDHYNKAKD